MAQFYRANNKRPSTTQEQINEAMARYQGEVIQLPDDRTTLSRWTALPRLNGKIQRSGVQGWDIDKVFAESGQFQPKFKEVTNDDTQNAP